MLSEKGLGVFNATFNSLFCGEIWRKQQTFCKLLTKGQIQVFKLEGS